MKTWLGSSSMTRHCKHIDAAKGLLMLTYYLDLKQSSLSSGWSFLIFVPRDVVWHTNMLCSHTYHWQQLVFMIPVVLRLTENSNFHDELARYV